jgi:carboxyl-terminal processing protease
VEGENLQHEVEKDSTRPKYTTAGGRTVYGGGGITPDYIVKADRLSEYAVQLRSKLVFLAFGDKYVEAHGRELKDRFGKESAAFASQFEITEAMLSDLRSLAQAKGIEFKKEQYEKDLRFIKAFMKASIAKSIWGNEGSTRVMLSVDNQYQEARTLFPEAERIAKNIMSVK